MRAPACVARTDWYAYWDSLRARLDGDIVIGDLNVDPSRPSKKDRVLPERWQVITPLGRSFRSLKNGTESTVVHALVRPGVEVVAKEYRPGFFGRWKLDHRPFVVDVAEP